MPSSGIQDVVWQWTAVRSGPGGEDEPVTDPTRYEVVFASDGKLAVKADWSKLVWVEFRPQP